MKNFLIFWVFLGAMGIFAAEDLPPKFSDFVVTSTEETLKEIDFSSHPDASNFTTRLEYHLGEPANFAGHYILTYWGCGTMCQMIAVIDVLDGSVFFSFDFATSFGACFNANSSMLITNPADDFLLEAFGNEMPDWFTTGYYNWDSSQMLLLAESQQAVDSSCVIP